MYFYDSTVTGVTLSVHNDTIQWLSYVDSHHCHESIPRDACCTSVVSEGLMSCRELNRLMRRPSSWKVSMALFLTEDKAKCIEDDRSVPLFFDERIHQNTITRGEDSWDIVARNETDYSSRRTCIVEGKDIGIWYEISKYPIYRSRRTYDAMITRHMMRWVRGEHMMRR